MPPSGNARWLGPRTCRCWSKVSPDKNNEPVSDARGIFRREGYPARAGLPHKAESPHLITGVITSGGCFLPATVDHLELVIVASAKCQLARMWLAVCRLRNIFCPRIWGQTADLLLRAAVQHMHSLRPRVELCRSSCGTVRPVLVIRRRR